MSKYYLYLEEVQKNKTIQNESLSITAIGSFILKYKEEIHFLFYLIKSYHAFKENKTKLSFYDFITGENENKNVKIVNKYLQKNNIQDFLKEEKISFFLKKIFSHLFKNETLITEKTIDFVTQIIKNKSDISYKEFLENIKENFDKTKTIANNFSEKIKNNFEIAREKMKNKILNLKLP